MSNHVNNTNGTGYFNFFFRRFYFLSIFFRRFYFLSTVFSARFPVRNDA